MLRNLGGHVYLKVMSPAEVASREERLRECGQPVPLRLQPGNLAHGDAILTHVGVPPEVLRPIGAVARVCFEAPGLVKAINEDIAACNVPFMNLEPRQGKGGHRTEKAAALGPRYTAGPDHVIEAVDLKQSKAK